MILGKGSVTGALVLVQVLGQHLSNPVLSHGPSWILNLALLPMPDCWRAVEAAENRTSPLSMAADSQFEPL